MYPPKSERVRKADKELKGSIRRRFANDPVLKIQANFTYSPSIRDPKVEIKQISFVNKNDDIEGTQSRSNISKKGREITSLLSTSIRYKREILITPDTKEDFLKKWTKNDFSLLDSSNVKSHLFIRNQIDIKVA